MSWKFCHYWGRCDSPLSASCHTPGLLHSRIQQIRSPRTPAPSPPTPPLPPSPHGLRRLRHRTDADARLPTWANQAAGRTPHRGAPPPLQRVDALFVSQLGWDVRVPLPNTPSSKTPRHNRRFSPLKSIWMTPSASRRAPVILRVSQAGRCRRISRCVRTRDADLESARPLDPWRQMMEQWNLLYFFFYFDVLGCVCGPGVDPLDRLCGPVLVLQLHCSLMKRLPPGFLPSYF